MRLRPKTYSHKKETLRQKSKKYKQVRHKKT